MGRGLMRRADADRRARRLLRWYPRSWRLRYGEEFTQLLIDDISERPRCWRRTLDVARSGVTARREWRHADDRRNIARFSVIAGAASIAAGFGVLGLVVAWHRYADLASHCGDWRGPPHLGPMNVGPAPPYTCLPIIGSGQASPSTYLYFALGCAVVGACLFVLARRIWRACAALHAGIVWPVPRSRLAAAVLIVGATLGGAAVLHGLQGGPPVCPHGFICAWGTGARPGPFHPRHAWADSAALGIFMLGLAGALAVLLTPRRLAAAVLVLGAGLASAAALRVYPLPPVWEPDAFSYWLWVGPATLGLFLLGVAGAAAVLITARPSPSRGPDGCSPTGAHPSRS
jgi:hypothetical protein